MRAENESMKAEEKQLNFRLRQTWRKIRELEDMGKGLESQCCDGSMGTTHVWESKEIYSDPGLNNEFKVLRELLLEKDKRIQKLEDELRGTQFVQSSVPGKKLVERCKLLQDENGDLAKQISEDATQGFKLEIAELKNQLKDNSYKMHKLREEHAEVRKENMDLEATIEYYTKNIHEAHEAHDTALRCSAQLETPHEPVPPNP